MGPKAPATVLERLRSVCLGLPEVVERQSHGSPAFFVRGKRAFLMVASDHHGDGRYAAWCAAPAGMQGTLVATDAERFFVPPYVGCRGWIGVRLDRGVDWDELEGIVEDAFVEVAPARLVEVALRQSARAEVDWSQTDIRGRHGFDVVDSPAELQAEVSGRPRKTTGNQTQVRKTTSHSLPDQPS